MDKLYQGDILRIESIKHPVLIVSKDYFNTSGEFIGCPIIERSVLGPLHFYVSTDEIEGFVNCEKLALLDMTYRGFKKIGRLSTFDLMNISDAIQGIFEYI